MLFIIFIFLSLIKSNSAIIGFNCESTDLIINTYSLLDTGECDFQQENVTISNTTIELLQIAEFKSIKIMQCKIEIQRTVFHCGMFSHLGTTAHALQEYLYEISHEKCKFIHETGIFKYDNIHTIADLKINSTRSVGIDFAGSVKDKTCKGASYTDNFGSWDNVLVQGLIRITLLEEYAQVSLKNNKLRLNSGTICKFTDEHCIDSQAGYTFWEHLPAEEGFKTEYETLYRGPAKIINSANQNRIYTVNSIETTFSLSALNNINICNRILTKTEHPKLFILDLSYNKLLFDNNEMRKEVTNLDIFTYVNSKFVYIEKHFRADLKDLYFNILKEKCEIEKKIIRESLSLASIAPDEFAYNIMQKPGYIAKLAGEVVHVIKCTPVEVQLKHTNKCYIQLPVTTKNETWFLTPKTHILLKSGSEINCNSIIPQYYKIGEDWINLLPKPRTTKNIVKILRPNTQTSWMPKKITSLATSGIYSQEDLQELQQHIMFPFEKAALLNAIARGIQGEENSRGDLLSNLLTENTLSNIAENTWKKFINKLTTFGSISSAIIMILIILHIIKLIMDAIIRGYTLHTIYGWSIHLLGAIFSSITHLIIILNNNQMKKIPRYEEIELKEVKIEKPVISEPMVLQSTLPRPTPPPLPSKSPYITLPSTSTSTPSKPTSQEQKEIRLFSISRN